MDIKIKVDDNFVEGIVNEYLIEHYKMLRKSIIEYVSSHRTEPLSDLQLTNLKDDCDYLTHIEKTLEYFVGFEWKELLK